MILYAKLPIDEREYPGDSCKAELLFHLKSTYYAAQSILDIMGPRLLESIGKTCDEWERFRKILLWAAVLHDLGKANTHFQKMINPADKNLKEIQAQSVRHEWVTYILLRKSSLGEWVQGELESADDFSYLCWAITGHHQKEKEEETNNESGMKLLVGTAEFQEILDWIADELNASPAPLFFKKENESEKKLADYRDAEEFLLKNGNNIRIQLKKEAISNEPSENEWLFQDLQEKAFMGSLRSLLMAADVLASAMGDIEVSRGKKVDENEIHDWVKENLANLPTPEQIQNIVEECEKSILQKSSKTPINNELSRQRDRFQRETACSKTYVTLVTAGCGSGKTLAAYQWGKNHCQETGSRLFFCYPTTGTATEGFLDYLIDDENQQLGNLLHSRVAADLNLYHWDTRLRSEKKLEEFQTEIKSLNIWGTGLVCCTVDTVLRFLINAYSGHLAWPAFTQGIYVFDEIHSYDDTLFSYLISFLQIVRNTPILLMTASLPKHRLKQIQNVVKNERGEELTLVEGPKCWENIKRYRQINLDHSPIEEVMERYNRGEKILWICNTVGRAMKNFDEIRSRNPDCSLISYHSHFKYEDRVKRHRNCVDIFKKEGPVICVTTQVAEMSLDISADFLVSELAPIPALIQRLGRLNRRATSNGSKPFLIIEPTKDSTGRPNLAPYSNGDHREWWDESQKWLKSLGFGDLSQADLTAKWSEISKEKAVLDPTESSPWLAAGPWMTHDSLRETNTGCEVILDSDIEAVKRGGRTAFLQKVIQMGPIPSNMKVEIMGRLKYGCLVIQNGNGIIYSPERGGEWGFEPQKTPDGIKEILIV